jgi:hypothetical protein
MAEVAIDRFQRVRLLWEGDALQDTSRLWRVFLQETDDLSCIIDEIEAAGRRDPAFECEADTLTRMREIADQEC